jgi:hypothetical protein
MSKNVCGLSASDSCIITGMSIQDYSRKFKDFWGNSDVLLVLIIVGTAVGGFVLGRESVIERNTGEGGVIHDTVYSVPVQKSVSMPESQPASPVLADPQDIEYVASKSGTKYHLPWCAGAQQIKEENKVYFSSKEEAENAGYTPASNCKGI